MMGLFPSNFVEVLDDSFRPASRASSPMPGRSLSPSPFNPQPSVKAKAKPSRKPFQSYSQPDSAAIKRAELQKQDSLSLSRAPSPNPMSVHDNIGSVPSPQIRGYGSRAPSPAPPMHIGYGSRAPSPMPPRHNGYGSRASSPAPSFQYAHHSRAPSPNPQFDIGSSPPPPPPPHRTTYTAQGSINSCDPRPNGYHTPRGTSPCPPSPGPTGLTPSPLRDAMDDVMSSLADMGIRSTESPEVPLDPWSPEAFDQTYTKARRAAPLRPQTVMGIGAQNGFDDYDPKSYGGSSSSRYEVDQPPPQLSNYVQRMENRLSKMHSSSPRPPRMMTVAQLFLQRCLTIDRSLPWLAVPNQNQNFVIASQLMKSGDQFLGALLQRRQILLQLHLETGVRLPMAARVRI